MQRRFLDTHLTLECSKRVVQCVYCNDEFAFWRLEVSQPRYIKGLDSVRGIKCPLFLSVTSVDTQRGTSYNGLYWEAPLERGTFFKHQVYERVGISKVGVNETGSRKSSLSFHQAQKG